MRFYGDYLYRFEPMSIKNGSIFAKEGMNANEVYFLLSGCVECENQKKYYLPGTVFGETDVVLGRKRTDSYKTIDDSYILKLNKATFNEIMDEFTDFRDDIHKMVMDRERNRLERI
jgi:CRP-like cAMP-binding protein